MPSPITLRAFEARFPRVTISGLPGVPPAFTVAGVVSKLALMVMYRDNAGYAASLTPVQSEREAVQALLTAGLWQLQSGQLVDLALPTVAQFANLCAAPFMPAVFRLTPAEAAVVGSPMIQPGEAYARID